MSTNKTVNYNLHSWAATDYVRRIEFNDNFNIIDSTVKNIETVANGKAPAVHVHTDATQTVAGFQSAADKTKLDGVATSANNYTHPSTHAPSIIVQDINNRFVTDTEKTYWNAKASIATATVSVNGLMASTDKAKLDGVENSANNYTHPAAHSPSIITQDISNRFVTDAEKATWNAKAPTTAVTTTVNGLMTYTDKVKLNSVADSANNYVHPATHPASVIVQDASNRFMTDTERTKLTAIAENANNYIHPLTHPASIIVQDATNRFMTDAERAKLGSVADNANNYIHPAAHPASIITQDASNRFMTDAERNKLAAVEASANNYAHPVNHPPSIITQDATNRFTTDADISKLAGIAVGANNYTHPANHPASVITQDVNNRFATDAEKTAWNAKAPTTAVTTLANGLMIAADKSKLDGVAAGANNYVHPATHSPSVIVQDASNRFVTDAEKTAWNNKPGGGVATTTTDGMMSSTDKTKLDGVETAANNYIHPVNHPASIITQDVSNRFVSDTEKATWNAKASTSIATTTVDGLLDSADKVKLDGIAASANNYTHPATHPPSVIVQDASNRFMTDAERTKLTGIATGANNYVLPAALAPSIITQDASNRFMTDAERTKLSGVATGANNYVLPATLPPSIIAQDLNNRFVTDADEAIWNGKASTAVATAVANGLMPMADKAKLDGFTVVAAPTANSVLKLDANSKLPASITGNADGNAASATKLLTTRAITLTGDVTGTVNFDGSAAVSIATVSKVSGVTAGTYPKVTVDNKGSVTAGAALVAADVPALDFSKITTGKPTTLLGYGITDASKTSSITATLPAVAGWYRVATSALNMDRNAGRFEVDWTLSSHHGQVNLMAGIMYGVDPTLDQLMYSNFSALTGITQVRIVYHVTYTGNYAYLEVYNAGANALVITTQLASSLGWSLITPIAGSIPAGYSTANMTFVDGIATDGILASQVATGTAPLAVNSTTVVPNLNVDMLDGLHASAFAPVAHVGTGGTSHLAVTTAVNGFMIAADKTKLDGIAASANNYVHPASHPPSIITQDVSNRFVTDAEKVSWNAKASTAIATTTVDGLMAWEDFNKLTGIAASANNYVHPAAHAPSVITQDASNRFVTDTEKATWNAKQAAGSYLTTTGIAADSSKLGSFAASSYLRSDAADSGTALTLLASLTVDDIYARTGDGINIWAGGVNIFDLYHTPLDVGHAIISAGKAKIKFLNGSLQGVQIRNALDDGYGTIHAETFTMPFGGGMMETSTYMNVGQLDNNTYAQISTSNALSFAIYEDSVSAWGIKYLGASLGTKIQASSVMLKFISGVLDVRNTADTAFAPIKASAFTVNSVRESKTNIVELNDDALQVVNNTKVYNYQLKSEFNIWEDDNVEEPVLIGQKDISEVDIKTGLILDEAPEAIISDNTIDIYSMNAFLWRAVQQLSDKVTALEAK